STIVRVATALTGNAADTEDLVQETFLRAYRHWHTFQPGSECKRWLATICRHTFAERRRRANRSIAVDDQELESLATARLHNTARAKGVDDMFARLDLGPPIAPARQSRRTRLRPRRPARDPRARTALPGFRFARGRRRLLVRGSRVVARHS